MSDEWLQGNGCKIQYSNELESDGMGLRHSHNSESFSILLSASQSNQWAKN